MWNKPIKTFSLVASSFCLGVAGTLLLHEKKGQNSVEKITNQHLLHTENSFSPNQSTQNSHSTLSKTKRFQTLISELESNSHSTSRSCLKNPWNETLIHAVQKAAPSLVHILSEKLKPSGKIECSSGSGFIIDSKGLILTNSHVIGSSSLVAVTLQDGRKIDGVVRGIDSSNDLCIIELIFDANQPSKADHQPHTLQSDLPAAQLGNSNLVQQGETVVALGTPFNLRNTATVGILSSVCRDPKSLGLIGTMDYLQTDASMNEGNSGGPLVDLDGVVIGINTVKAEGSGIHFSIPINCAKDFLLKWLKDPHEFHPFIGCKILELNETTWKELSQNDPHFPQVKSGIFVPFVQPNSPAEKSGLAAGDVILAVNGQEVFSPKDINQFVHLGVSCQLSIISRYNVKKVIQVEPIPPIVHTEPVQS